MCRVRVETFNTLDLADLCNLTGVECTIHRYATDSSDRLTPVVDDRLSGQERLVTSADIRRIGVGLLDGLMVRVAEVNIDDYSCVFYFMAGPVEDSFAFRIVSKYLYVSCGSVLIRTVPEAFMHIVDNLLHAVGCRNEVKFRMAASTQVLRVIIGSMYDRVLSSGRGIAERMIMQYLQSRIKSYGDASPEDYRV